MRRGLLAVLLMAGVVAGYGSALAHGLGYDGWHPSCSRGAAPDPENGTATPP